MVKKVAAVLLLIVLCSSLFALDMSNAKEYQEGEFPKWTVDLRRSEIIFFGSVPFTFTATSLIVNKAAKQNLDFWETAAIACSASAVIAVIDLIIGKTKK